MPDVTALQDLIAKNSVSARPVIRLSTGVQPTPAPQEPEKSEEAIPAEPAEVVLGGFARRDLPATPGRIQANISNERMDPEEFQRVLRGQERIRVALEEVVESDPEGRASLRRQNERLTTELREAYRELGALRRATAGSTPHPGAGYYERMGQGLERDAETLLDLLDQYEDLPEELGSHLRQMAQQQNQFALNCIAYAGTLG